MKFLQITVIFFISLLFLGCNESSTLQEVKVEKSYDFFKNSSEIKTDKLTILIFGNRGCKYCEILKDDIAKDTQTKEILTNDFNSYYIETDKQKEHSVVTDSKNFKITSDVLSNMYKINATPTTVINDENFETILMIPGYVPNKMFKASLNFIKEKRYENKENIYKELQRYYKEKGLI